MGQHKTTFIMMVCALGWVLAASGCSESEAAQQNAEAPAVRVEAITMAHTTHDVMHTYSGYLSPWNNHGLGFMVACRVTSLHVKEGDRVKKGQLIATISAEDYALIKQMADIQADTIEPNL